MNNETLTRRSLCAGILTVAALFPFDTAAFAANKKKQDGERLTDKSRIDWNKGVITATGRGAIDNRKPNQAKAYLAAAEYAKYDAIANLLMAIEHVKIDARTVGRDFEADTTIKAEITGLVRGAQVVSERRVAVGANSIIEVTVATPLYGDQSIASVFIPEVMKRNEEENDPDEQPTERILPEIKVEPRTRPVPQTEIRKPRGDQRITGVIIDARGLNIDRSMSPKIRHDDGSEVWGTVNADPDYVIEHGIVVYANSMGQAQNDDRAGNNPLVLRAIGRASGRFHTDVVLSDNDADRLMELNEKFGFLDKYRVVFLVDPGK